MEKKSGIESINFLEQGTESFLSHDVSELARSVSKMFHNEGYQCHPMVRHEVVQAYPTTWKYPCFHCRRLFETMPFFVILDRPPKCSYWKLDLMGYHTPECCRDSIIERYPLEEKGILLDHFNAFLRECVDPSLLELGGYIPLESVKELSPFGTMTWKEWDQNRKTFTGLIRHPPFAFVETWLETKKKPISKTVVEIPNDQQIKHIERLQTAFQEKKKNSTQTASMFRFDIDTDV